ncbi:MAG: TonB-dependent receptor plug domain-containing protein, partial [Gammaproteobacteria bacterium]|nr:TonB-dependent receptor plug domain-containing protein [Gammaproteobacteria bacterium]
MISRRNKYFVSSLSLPWILSFSLLMPLTQLYAAEKNSNNTNLEKYLVTGSHIKRLDIEGPAPVTVLDQEEIKLSGASTLNELLKNLTLNTGFMLNENLPLSQTPGAASINMRGLGQDATLILLNGRRTSNFPYAHNNAESFVDLNSIPLAAIDRVEVLKDGASAIYGSDALAGVINIILKKDYDGSEISLSYGVSGEGDADETHVNFIKGISNDKDNLTFVFDYFKRESFLMSDRSFSRTAFQPDINPTYGNDYTAWDFHPANYYDTGSTFSDFTNFTATTMGVSGFFDPNPWISAIPESERIGGVVSYKRDINTDLTFFTDLMLSQVNTSYQFAPTALWGEFDGVVLPAAHPTNFEATDLFLLWRMTDLGPRINDIKTDSIRLVAGFEGMY